MDPIEAEAWTRRIEGALASLDSEYHVGPIIARDPQGLPAGRPAPGDALVFACRRGEREIQITRALVDEDFHEFKRGPYPGLSVLTLTRYHDRFASLPCLFGPVRVEGTIGEAVSEHGWRQFRASESDKFAHVTRFLNGGRTAPFPGEECACIPSQKGRSPRENPSMAALDVARRTAEALESKEHRFLAVNLANGDVVGHVEDFESKVLAAGAVDEAVGILTASARASDVAVMLTADHGVLEKGFTGNGNPNVGHTTAQVPAWLDLPGGETPGVIELERRALKDVAPTLCALLGIPAPSPMTGSPLFHAFRPSGRVLLVVLDGWGLGEAGGENPIHVARTPVLDALSRRCPPLALEASGESVGLLPGKPGNSEAGHLNLGAGRVVAQDDVRIDKAVRDGVLEANPVLLEVFGSALRRGGEAHVLGLLSDRSSHGTFRELAACARGAQLAGAEAVWLHLILDGRSSPPGSAPRLLDELARELCDVPGARIGTVMGRAFALDRDGNWESRTRVAYEALVLGTVTDPAGGLLMGGST